jgi:alkaline phosphatase D
MTNQSNRRDFLIRTSSTAVAVAASASLAACGGGENNPVLPSQFLYGVASGDPLPDRVVLWTHAKIPSSSSAVNLTWQVAIDASFSNIVQSGRIQATEAAAFTAKVDVTGLAAGTSYLYRFMDDAGAVSRVGNTRTLPAANAGSVKLAVFSCALFSEGFFNAYDAAAKSDAQYAIHLGDYIYEYGSAPEKFGNSAVPPGRTVVPANDIVSLSDYRSRYALYRSDPNLQDLHARMPWITVWDDHEFADNAWVLGAQNHDAATQGDWITRRNIAARVYHEWMPIRTPDPANLLKIYRSFDFGNLLSLYMLDTRIEGRDRQYSNFGDADGGTARYVAGLVPNAGVTPDSPRRMISTAQQDWLTAGMAASRASWQFLGNQDIMARIWFPASVLLAQAAAATNPAGVQTAISAYLTAKATRATNPAALALAQSALLSPVTNPRLPYNLDSWDGYPSNREAILQTVKAQGKRLVALSGDSHNGWFNNLTTLAGEKVGVEFACTSVTAPGFESVGLGDIGSSLDGSALVPTLGTAAIGAGLGLIDDVNYSDTARRGYLLITVTAEAVKSEYVYVSTVKSTVYTASIGRTISVASSGAITYA